MSEVLKAKLISLLRHAPCKGPAEAMARAAMLAKLGAA